jgi:DNA-binding GntR family transcriptional regulator
MASEPVTQRITDDLRRQIQDGTLGPGALLPSEPEVAHAYGVSRQTARTALQALEREGLVAVRPRRGRIVRSSQRLRWHLSEFERPDHTVLTTSDAWETDIESQGHDPTTDPAEPEKALKVERISPPPAIAERLRLDPKTDVCVVRRHVRYIDGKSAIIADDFFDEQIVRGTELAEPEDTTRENILAEAGYEQVYDIDEIITRMPTPDEVARLGIPTGTPVAEHIRTGYTAADKPVRVMISIIPGDTLILQYKIPT